METSRKKIIFKNVEPAILSNACVLSFSVVDAIFVGNGAGSQALGAVNLALPFVLLAQALNAMASIGGVTITAIRFGRGDKEGAQNAFMHSLTAIHMWEYCWGFIVGSLNTIICAYFYSTKRSGQAIALNIVRSLIMNALIITFLPKIFGSAIVWHTFGIYEVLVLILAVILKKSSEQNGIVYK